MHRVRPWRLLGAAALAAGAGAVWAPAPAGALSDPGITIGLGQSITRTFPAITGDDALSIAEANVYPTTGNPNGGPTDQPTPQSCQAAPNGQGCADVPITLAVPPSSVQTTTYILSIAVSWPAQTVDSNTPELGPTYTDTMQYYLWEDPPAQVPNSPPPGTHPAFDSQDGVDPGNMTSVGPQSVHLDVLADNQAGVNSGFTLTVSLTDAAAVAFNPSGFGSSGFGGFVGGGVAPMPGTTGSVPGGGQVGTSPVVEGGGGGAAAPTAPAPPAAANVPPGTISAALARMGMASPPNALELGGPRFIQAGPLDRSGGPDHANGGALAASLLLIPLIALGLALWAYLRRRRRALTGKPA